jgi:thiol-disulfide isomerase/thioredoxin
MKRGIGSIILAMFFVFLTNAAVAQCGGCNSTSSAKNCKSETSKIALVKFSSDNCNACKSLEPKITQLKGKLSGEVVYVKFDFTNEESKSKTKTLANEQGLTSLLEAKSGTGYLVVYDLKNKKILTTLDNSKSVAEMENTINSYL